MWGVIVAVCAACIVGTITYSLVCVRKKNFDPATTMKAIVLSAVLAGLCMMPITYALMSGSVEREKAEMKEARKRTADESRVILDNARKDASTIKAEAEAKKASIDGEIKLLRARTKALRDSMKIAERMVRNEQKKQRTFRIINDMEQTIQNQEKTIEKTAAKIRDLDRNIELLKHAKLSIDNYQQIAELGLVRADIKRVLVHFDSVPDPPKDLASRVTSFVLQSDRVTDKILLVYTKNLNGAKIGIDMNELRISRQGENYVISGISAKYLGAEKQGITEILTEYRRTGYNKDGLENVVEVKKDKTSLQYVEKAKKKYIKTIEENAGIDDVGSFNDAVVAQAQKYLKATLAPLCKNGEDCIRFTDKEPNSSYLLMEYLNNELHANEKQWEEVSTSIEQTRNKIMIDKAVKNEMLEFLEKSDRGADEDDVDIDAEVP